MKSIRIENGIIVYYGNRVGWVSGGKVLVDPMFEGTELNAFLEKQTGICQVQWMDGMFDRLMNGQKNSYEVQILKDCRIWQLKSDVDIRMKFISYEELIKQFGQPEPENYQIVFEGRVDTNDLEDLYEVFNTAHPSGYRGHSLSMSDIVELYDELGSSFHYVDRFGFQQIDFTSHNQTISQSMQL